MKLRKIKVKNNESSNFKFKLFMMFTVIALFLSVGYSALNEDLSISSEAIFIVEKVKNLKKMFYGCSKLTELDI